MADQEGLKSRVGAMLKSAFARVLDEMQANPVSFVVIVGATAISYESLYMVAHDGLGMPFLLALLFPLVFDVAAYPALTTMTNRSMGALARMFGFLVSMLALVGSLYGNFARHLADAAATAPWAHKLAVDWAWTVVGTVRDGNEAVTTIISPSFAAITFVSAAVPLTIVTTIVLSLFKPKAEKPIKKAKVKASKKSHHAVATQPAPASTRPPVVPVPGSGNEVPAPSSIDTPTVGARQRQFIRDYYDKHADFPTTEQINREIPDPHRNTDKVLASMKKKISEEQAEKEQTG